MKKIIIIVHIMLYLSIGRVLFIIETKGMPLPRACCTIGILAILLIITGIPLMKHKNPPS